MSTSPGIKVALAPKRLTSRAVTKSENSATQRFIGMNARPAPTGEYPSTRCRYRAPRKKAPNLQTGKRARTSTAPATLRDRKKRSGTSG